jgi:deazaflavin-dependent oxidoreductase (nitroreductase family)
MRAFGAFHAGVYRLSKGKIGGKVGQMPILLLTVTGRQSGQPRTCPLGYVPDDDRLLLVASALGAAKHPAWYHNLHAEPHVTIRRGDADERMTATTATGAERARLWARLVADYPFFAEHQRKTTREIPIVILTAATGI